MVASEIVPPVAYHPMWLVAAAVAAMVAIAGLVWLIRDLRPPRQLPAGPAPSLLDLRDARARVLTAIDEIERRFARSELDLRESHLELSWLVRSFVAANSQLDARSLTAGEVRASKRAPDLADMLGRFEEPTFAEDPQAALKTSADEARAVVRRW